MVIGESGFEARAGRVIVSGYSGVCFEIKVSGRHRGFDGVKQARLCDRSCLCLSVCRLLGIMTGPSNWKYRLILVVIVLWIRILDHFSTS